jgi:hypothetical protein
VDSTTVFINILLNKSNLKDIFTGQLKVGESNLVVDVSQITLKSYFIFKQFLFESIDFQNFFSEDGKLALINTFSIYPMDKSCKKCNTKFTSDKHIRICYECYNIYHISCTDKKSNKKYYCC